MINYDSIISAYNDKPTLMEWLKKVEEALKGASATSFSVNKKGNATISFQIDFEDGTSLESGDIILQQGEGVASAAIVNGHLVLTLTNGDELDAGDLGAVSGFSIDASQHLIVTYQDGTTNDLGAIFNGNVNISGILTASSISTPELTTSGAKIDVLKPVEVTGALKADTLEQSTPNNEISLTSFTMGGDFQNCTRSPIYIRILNVNGILHMVFNFTISNETAADITGSGYLAACYFTLPPAIAQKVIDFNGHTAAVADSSYCLICAFEGFVYSAKEVGGTGKTPKGYLNINVANWNSANVIGCVFRLKDSMTINAGATNCVTGRVALTLF